MNIITAKEAREKTEKYVSGFIELAVDYVMREIKEVSSGGGSSVYFYNDTSILYFETMKTDKFVRFIEKLGYKYDYTTQEYCGNYSEEIKISW